MVQLEPIAKLADEGLYELYVARVLTEQGPGLVSARKLKPACVDAQGALDALGEAVSHASRLESPFLLKPIGLFRGQGYYWWLSQRSFGYDAETLISRLGSREVRISPVNVLQIGLDFLQGLASLHTLDAVHAGIIPRSIVVDLNGTTRLDGAFFDATLMGIKELRKLARRGHKSYLAPELAQSRAPDASSDVFAAAAVMYHLLTGQPPMDGGLGMSTRHQAIKPPSKVDRSLPYSCDAVFIKALSTAPRQRHESVQALLNAISRLRKSLLSGPDEGKKMVSEFLRTLYPNEAKVVGMPGTLERPAIVKTITLSRLDGQSALSLSASSLDTEPVAKPLADRSDEKIEFASVNPADDASREWGFPEKAKPLEDSLPCHEQSSGDSESSTDVLGRSALFGRSTSNQQTQPLAVADSSFVPERDREKTDLNRPPVIPVQGDHGDVGQSPARGTGQRQEQEPEQEEFSSPGDMEYSEDEQTDSHVDDVQVPEETPPPWRRPAFIVAASILGITFIALIFLLLGVFSGDAEVKPTGPPDGQTSLIGFLSLNADSGSRVIMDGEQLNEPMPLVRKLVRAGTHRLQVFTKAGVELMDEQVLIQSGEHKEIRLVIPKATTPDSSSAVKKPVVRKVHKTRTSKHRTKRKKKTYRKTRKRKGKLRMRKRRRNRR